LGGNCKKKDGERVVWKNDLEAKKNEETIETERKVDRV